MRIDYTALSPPLQQLGGEYKLDQYQNEHELDFSRHVFSNETWELAIIYSTAVYRIEASTTF